MRVSSYRYSSRTVLPLIRQLVDSYSALYPEESFPILLEQISREEDITSRKNFVGHVVADGCIIDPKNKKILLIHHRALGKWLKPGGHIDE